MRGKTSSGTVWSSSKSGVGGVSCESLRGSWLIGGATYGSSTPRCHGKSAKIVDFDAVFLRRTGLATALTRSGVWNGGSGIGRFQERVERRSVRPGRRTDEAGRLGRRGQRRRHDHRRF